MAILIVVALALTTGSAIVQAQSQPNAGRERSAAPPAVTSQSHSGAAAPSAGADDQGGLGANVAPLPFTGIDLLILGGIVLVLLGCGLAVRRLSAPRV